MEEGNLYQFSNSIRANSSIWSNSSAENFSGSRREGEDDEEALKWAAIERLPTHDRLKKGLFTTSQGEVNEIQINRLASNERKSLVNRLVKVAEEDNEKFLLKLRERIDR